MPFASRIRTVDRIIGIVRYGTFVAILAGTSPPDEPYRARFMKTEKSRPAKSATKSVKSPGKNETIDGEAFAPELCRTSATAPAGDDWLHEVKWDGYRMLATVAQGKVRLWSRNAIEWTQKLPEIVAAIANLKLKSAQFDGELVALRDERDDFNALQGRLSAENRVPAVLVLFDVLHLNDRSLRELPLIERKRVLSELLDESPQELLRFSEHQVGHGKEVFAAAVRAKREGIVSKRVDSTYVGSRNGDWVKVKTRPSDEFVVIGFTEPKGSRSGIGALLLARSKKGRLSYAGRVGTGFGDAHLRSLRKQLDAMVVAKTDADIDALARKDHASAIWVRPKLVAEVYHQGIGGKGLLRQPAFKAIREDKNVTDIKKPDAVKRSTRSKSVSTRAAKPSVASTPRAPAKKSAPRAAPSTADYHLTHPERVVFAKLGITKGDVARYYAAVAERMLPELANRPLSLLRCPDGVGKECFFQKHIGQNIGKHVERVRIRESSGVGTYFSVNDAAGLLELVQMNALEFHPWGAQVDDVEHCDRMVFDLDPDRSVTWQQIVAAARDVKAQLAKVGLESFVRTSGGKGLHVVVPLEPAAAWDDAREFSGSFARAMSELAPDKYVATAGEKNRRGRIFIDWLRNGRGATSVASYSLRARAEGGIAMPLTWTQLGRSTSGSMYSIAGALKAPVAKRDPWEGIAALKQKLPSR